jgi:predicted transcriptional regulator
MQTIKQFIKHDLIKAESLNSVSSLIGKMKESGSDTAIVFENGQFIGLFSPIKLSRSKLDVAKTKIGSFVSHPQNVEDDDEIHEVLRGMYNSNSNVLPVMNDDEVQGVVYGLDLLNAIAPELEFIEIQDLKKPKNIFVSEQDRIGKVIEILSAAVNFVVVRSKKGDIIGYVSHKELLTKYLIHHHERDAGGRRNMKTRAFKAERPDLLALPVSSFMNEFNGNSLSGEDTIATAVKYMRELNEGYLLVDGFDVLSYRDILREVFNLGDLGNFSICLIGIKKQDNPRYLSVKNIAVRYAQRFDNLLPERFSLKVHLKTFNASEVDKKHRYEVFIVLESSALQIRSNKKEGWDILEVVNDGLKSLHERLQKHVR